MKLCTWTNSANLHRYRRHHEADVPSVSQCRRDGATLESNLVSVGVAHRRAQPRRCRPSEDQLHIDSAESRGPDDSAIQGLRRKPALCSRAGAETSARRFAPTGIGL